MTRRLSLSPTQGTQPQTYTDPHGHSWTGPQLKRHPLGVLHRFTILVGRRVLGDSDQREFAAVSCIRFSMKSGKQKLVSGFSAKRIRTNITLKLRRCGSLFPAPPDIPRLEQSCRRKTVAFLSFQKKIIFSICWQHQDLTLKPPHVLASENTEDILWIHVHHLHCKNSPGVGFLQVQVDVRQWLSTHEHPDYFNAAKTLPVSFSWSGRA